MADSGALAARYDGYDAAALQRLLDLPRVVVFDSVGSTMDVAHDMADAGAPAGTLVLADEQLSGRGRAGRRWQSGRGAGVWLTLIERPIDVVAIRVLSLRIGIRLAPVLERYTTDRVLLKWPNDLFVGTGKLAGVLTEARWKESRPDWVAIGVGVNLHPPDLDPPAAALSSVTRPALLGELIPAIRAAAHAVGSLTARELDEFGRRDLARGRWASAPRPGRVAGIDADGHLLIAHERGIDRCQSGSLVLEDAPNDSRL